MGIQEQRSNSNKHVEHAGEEVLALPYGSMNPVEYWCQAFSARRGYFCCLARHLHAGRQHETIDGTKFNVPIRARSLE